MGSSSQIHSKILTAAGREILQPMGLAQRGRSRIWRDDRGWWMCVVEFQPSSWSRGSYLNVGCMWLWRVKDHVTFDVGHRVEGHVEYIDEEQFRSSAANLARIAAQEVTRYRALFPNINAVCDYFRKKKPLSGWPEFDAAIAYGLAGRIADSKAYFRRVAELNDDRGWWLTAQADVASLSRLVDDTAQFRQTVSARVQQCRSLQRLQPMEAIDFG